MDIHKDINYGGKYDNCLDLFISRNNNINNNGCLIIFVHGGLWVDGNKGEYSHLQQLSSNTGLLEKFSSITTSVIDYPLSKTNNIQEPTHTQEISKALRFLVEEAPTKYNYRADKIYLMGHSCGATMISVLYFKSESYNLPKEIISSIKGLICISGIYDLQSFSKEMPSKYIDEFYLSHPKELYNEWISPINGDFINTPKCNLLIYHSKADPYVELTQSVNFEQKLKNNGSIDLYLSI